MNALYEISRSFSQTLSLDATLDAVTTTLVEQLGIDAAVIRVPDERGDQLVAHKVHVAESRLDAPVSTVLGRPQPRPRAAPRAAAARPGDARSPRRRPRAPPCRSSRQGSTAALLPIATADGAPRAS